MRILLSGYYGFGNLGDESILAGLATALRARGHEPVVLSGDPPATRALHRLEARHRVRGLVGAIASVDAVVSGGGGLLQDKTSARSLDYYLLVLRLARLAGRVTAVYGQSLGPLSESGRAKVARALRDVPLFVRDQASVTLAATLGLGAVLVGDAALLSAEPMPRPPLPSGNRERPVILVPRGGYDEYNDVLARLATKLYEAGRSVGVLALHPQEDDKPAELIRRGVPDAIRLEARTPRGALESLRGASYVVSARLHGSILAALAGVGFVGLSYDPKVAGFLEQAGAKSFETPVDEQALLAVVSAGAPADSEAVTRLLKAATSGVDALLTSLESGRG